MGKKYEARTDLEKIQSQWHKLTGLHGREEWSAAIVRTATAAELAANFAIRQEFDAKSEFDSEFVDGLLFWANGLAGKMSRLLLPLNSGGKRLKKIKPLNRVSAVINQRRNEIVHQGKFSSEKDAKAAIEQTRGFIETLVRLYEPKFRLKDQE